MIDYKVSVSNGAIILPEQAEQLFSEIRLIDSEIKALEDRKKQIEQPLKQAMMESGVSKFANDILTATTVGPSTVRKVNTDRLKADGLFEKYSDETERPAYVRITYKKVKE